MDVERSSQNLLVELSRIFIYDFKFVAQWSEVILTLQELFLTFHLLMCKLIIRIQLRILNNFSSFKLRDMLTMIRLIKWLWGSKYQISEVFHMRTSGFCYMCDVGDGAAAVELLVGA